MQTCVHAFLLGQFPGFVLIDVFVHSVGQEHHFAQCFGVVTLIVKLRNGRHAFVQLLEQSLTIGRHKAQFAT